MIPCETGSLLTCDMPDRETLLADEELIIRTSGEIPEVAYQGTLFYLTEDPDGPHLTLNNDELVPFKEAVVARYRDIILRDLTPANRDKGLYRGLARSAVNWQRCKKYCREECRQVDDIRDEVAAALQKFICQEVSDVQGGGRQSSINCTAAVVRELAGELRLDIETWPEGWQDLCNGG